MKLWMIVVLLYALAVLHHLPVWHDEIPLWQDASRKAPGLVRPHVRLADAYTRKGYNFAANQEWQKVAEILLQPEVAHTPLITSPWMICTTGDVCPPPPAEAAK